MIKYESGERRKNDLTKNKYNFLLNNEFKLSALLSVLALVAIIAADRR